MIAEGTDTTSSQSIIGKGIRVSKAYLAWALAGFPTRAKEEQKRILTTICVDCPFYSTTNKTCKKCGCALPSKIKQETSHCPLTPPKW